MLRIVVLVAIASAAHAEPPPFVSLDRATGSTNAGVHLGLMLFEDQDSDGGEPTFKQPRLQLFGEYAITPNVGVMASASLVHFSSEPRSETGLGTTFVGGYGRYVVRDLEAIARVSLVLPTAGFIPRDSYFEDPAMHGSLFPFLEERAYDAGAFWLHTGVTVRYRRGPWFAQADAMFDIALQNTGGEFVDDQKPIRMHVGGGVGYRAAPWRATVEVVWSSFPWESQLYADLASEEFFDFVGLTLSGAYALDERQEVVAWFANPLNEYIRSRWHAIGVGYQRAF